MKKFLSLVLALVMTMSLVTVSAGAKDFTDAEAITYQEAVDVLSAIKVIDGYADDSFNPTATLTRQAAAKIICNLVLGPTAAASLVATTAPFKDVPANSQFAGWIAYCVQQGIISGYADGTFKPGNSLTGFAFLKMLLGALGYNSENEKFTGPNWSVNVAKQALNSGLTANLATDFVGTKAVTREEACLYSLNTLTADMVEYENSGSSISINGVVIDREPSKAQSLEWVKSGNPSMSTTNDGNIDGLKKTTNAKQGDGYVQFAEMYFPKLTLEPSKVLDGGTYYAVGRDAFNRPANKWKYQDDEIGTYVAEADATFHDKATYAEIYDESNAGDEYKYRVYIDGIYANEYNTEYVYNTKGEDASEKSTVTITKNNDDDKIGTGKGNLIEVYKDQKIITVINTYIGEVVGVDPATERRDRFIEIAGAGDHFDDIVNIAKDGVEYASRSKKHNDGIKNGDILPSDHNTFKTTDFEVDDVVTFNYSLGTDSVKNVQLAQSVTGDVKSYTGYSRFSLSDTSYDYAEMAVSFLKSEDVGTNTTIYLDENGYAMYFVEGDENLKNYAFLMACDSKSNLGGDTFEALLLLTDGSTKVVDVDKDYTKYGFTKNDGSSGLTQFAMTDRYSTENLVGQWVTYKTNSKGETVLSKPSKNAGKTANNFDTSKKSDSYPAMKENGGVSANNSNWKVGTDNKNKLTLGNNTVYINSTTLIIVRDSDKDGTDVKYHVYEGVKELPKITLKDDNGFYSYFTKAGETYAKLVFLDIGHGDITNAGARKTIFLVADDGADGWADGTDEYYVFDGVVEGELIEDGIKLDWTDTETQELIETLLDKDAGKAGNNRYNSMTFSGYSKDGDLYQLDKDDRVKMDNKDDDAGDEITSGEVTRVKGDSVTFGNAAFTLADGCKFWRVNSHGTLEEASLNALRRGDVGTGENDYYRYISYTLNSDQEITAIYWVVN